MRIETLYLILQKKEIVIEFINYINKKGTIR